MEELPNGMFGIDRSAFTPWTGTDSLAVGRLQSQQLAYSADEEIAQTEFVNATRKVFFAGATDAGNKKRAGFLADVVRFAPLDPTTAMDGFPNDNMHTNSATVPWLPSTPASTSGHGQTASPIPSAALAAARPWRAATARMRSLLGAKGFVGSNNWVVGPGRTATGHAMLASDPHLSLSAPAVFWMVHLHVDDPDPSKALDVAGLAFPGIPGIILGFNANVAWGATVTDYDVTDVYSETLTPDGASVMFKGQPVALEKVHETIGVHNSNPVEYDVLVVPHHGPLVPAIGSHQVMPPDPSKGALSIKWTGMQPTRELQAVAGFLRAKTVEDARVAVRDFAVGSQNWVFGDTSKNIFYTTESQIPTRDKRAYTWDPASFSGTLPCFVLPGDDGSAEWTGFLEEAFVPHVKNPPKGYVGTANGDQVGVTLDNDPSNDTLPNGQPVYLGCWHDPGFRVGRIHQRIEGVGHPMTLDDMASIQADARSALGARLTPKLLAAIAHAEAERMSPGTRPDLSAVVGSARYKAAPIGEIVSMLTNWGSDVDFDAPAGLNLDDGSPDPDPKASNASKATLLFNAWIVRMIQATFLDELTAIGDTAPPLDLHRPLVWLLEADPKTLATYDPAAGDSAIFDDLSTSTVVESRDERMITALLNTLDYLTKRLGADHDKWRWGTLHTLTFASLVPLWSDFSIPNSTDTVFPNGFPRHGDGYNIDVAEYALPPLAHPDAYGFTYNQGPTQRFVIDLDPAGPNARNVLPGGEVWDPSNKHFRDEAELWRKNQNHPVPFAHADVANAAEDHAVFSP